MPRYFAAFVATLVLIVGGKTGSGAEPARLEPVVLVVGASYDHVAQDLAYLGSTIQNEQFPEILGALLQSITGIKELNGLDQQRQWGVAVSTDGVIVAPVAFLPVTDLDAFLQSLEPRIGQPVKSSDGYYTLGQGSKTLVAVQEGDWAFIGQSRDVLVHKPNPTKLLEQASNQYDLMIQLNVQRIPEVFRTLAIDQVRLALRDSLQAAPKESPSDFALRKQQMTLQFGALEQLFSQTEQITAGWSLDANSKQMFVDLTVKPMAGGTLSKRMAAAANSTSQFAGLLDSESPFGFHLTRVLDSGQIEGALGQLAAYRAAALKKYVQHEEDGAQQECDQCREWIEQLFAAAERTVKAGHVDAAIRLSGKSDSLSLIGGARLADGNALREHLENWIEQSGDSSHVIGPTGEQLDGTPIYAWTMPARGRHGAAVERLFGADRKLYIAILPNAIWLAIGRDGLSAMQMAAAVPPGPAIPAELTIKLGTLASIAAEVNPNPALQGVLSLAGLNLRATDDRLTVRAEIVEGNARIRIEAHEGIIHAATLGATVGLAQLVD